MSETNIAEEVRGLRQETGRLATSIESVAKQQKETASAVDEKADQSEVDEVKRLSRRANLNTLGVIAVFVLVALVGGRLILDNRQTLDEMVAARTAGRAATCGLFNDFTQLLVSANPPKTEEARQLSVARVEAFRVQFEEKAAPLGCKFTFTVPPVSP